MKILKKVAAAALAMLMLTACSGGGGSAGGGGTPIAPSTFSSTKTYKLVQSGEGKPLYMEYWQGYTDKTTGDWISEKDTVIKQGSQGSKAYADVCVKGTAAVTMVTDESTVYAIYYANDSSTAEDGTYAPTVEIATLGGATVPKGKTVCLNMTRVWGQNGTAGSSSSSSGVTDPGKLDESKVTVEVGTYTMPDTSVKYYAEIFTSKAHPGQTITYAYDDNDQLKAVVAVYSEGTEAYFFNKFEYGSSEFKPARLNINSYNAMDITNEYIAGMKKLQSGK